MKEHKIPRILLAATSSGSGKTLLTCGILEALKQLNMNPDSYKCGPDYIDPMFHRTVLGVDGSNLDSFFSSDSELKSIVDNGIGDIAVIEGVMGIYDGAAVDSDAGSCYSVARAVNSGIILIIDAKGQGRTIVSVIKGILADDSDRLIKGIILNRMSENYYLKLKDYLEDELAKEREDVELIGFIPKLDGINLDSRHLGLKMPDEIEDIKKQVKLVAESLIKYCDIRRLVEIGKQEPLAENTACEAKYQCIDQDLVNECRAADITLAVARDRAFCFYYKENIRMIEEMGVNIVYFSPLNDREIPKADGILLGGGYPELHLERLSQNHSMIDSVKKCINTGVPCIAECGGFMYLHTAIEDRDGAKYKMVGVIDGECFYTGHLVRFGYIDVVLPGEKDGIKAHEFHYYDSTDNGDYCMATKADKSNSWSCIISDGVSFWGFPHLYYRSNPEFIRNFVKSMIIIKTGK